MDGFRSSLEKEFTSIYIFNLRGRIKGLSGELAKKEGQNVFEIIRGVSITLLVKNPNATNKKAEICYHDIGDYLNRKEKTEIISKFISIKNDNIEWLTIKPNENNDWLEQRNDVFGTYIPLEPNKKFDLKSQSYFNTYAIGVATNRDAWVYNFSEVKIEQNMNQFINFYNEQKQGFNEAKTKNSKLEIKNYINADSTKISWTRALRKDASKGINHDFKSKEFRDWMYRPFIKQQLYFDKPFIENPGLSSKFFPNQDLKIHIICITGAGDRRGFTCIISDKTSDLQILENSQQFPLYHYEENNSSQKGLFDIGAEGDYIRRDGVSDFILERAKIQYGKNVTKEDVFYYVYGFLHSPEYRETFANDLKKMLPRLPLLEDVRDFWAFSKAGRQLAELHLNYESVPAYEGLTVKQPYVIYQMTPDDASTSSARQYSVTKMKFPKKDQKDTIIYNGIFTIENIPAKAYEYVVNGKSAIEWIMERYQVTVHKDSGIKNDPNDWSAEVGNASYIYDLLLSVINVSVQTVDIVAGLPRVRFE